MLCDKLEGGIGQHLETLRTFGPVTLTKKDIATDPALFELYCYRIPVLTLNDRVILEGNPTPQEIELAFKALALS